MSAGKLTDARIESFPDAFRERFLLFILYSPRYTIVVHTTLHHIGANANRLTAVVAVLFDPLLTVQKTSKTGR